MKRLIVALFAILLLAVPALAQEFVIGLIPELNVFRQIDRHKPLAAYLGEKLGVEVRLTMLSRYGNIIESFSAGKMDAAFWGSFTGALAVEKLGVIPIARPVGIDGNSTYSGLVFVRKDSKIDSIGQLSGKSFAFVDRATTAGFLFPLAMLKSKGVTDYEKFFSSTTFTGSHDAAILSVLNGEFDGGAAKNTIFDLLARENPAILKNLKILGESAAVPSNTLSVDKDTDPALIAKLSDILLGMDKDPKGRAVLKELQATSFISTTAEDYVPVFDMAKRAGVNLKEYDYVNK